MVVGGVARGDHGAGLRRGTCLSRCGLFLQGVRLSRPDAAGRHICLSPASCCAERLGETEQPVRALSTKKRLVSADALRLPFVLIGQQPLFGLEGDPPGKNLGHIT